MNVQKSADSSIGKAVQYRNLRFKVAALYSRGESRVSGDMLPKWEYSRQYDPRYGHGISQAEGAVKLGQNMPTLREAYPLAADFEFSEEFYRKNGRLLIDAEPFITRTHTAFSKLPLGDSIETYHGKKFIVDRSNGSIEWYFPLTDGFLADKNVKLSDSGKLFVVENNYEVKEIGKNAYMTEIKNPPKDLKVDDAPPRDFAAIAKLSILFGLDGARLAEGCKLHAWMLTEAYVWINPGINMDDPPRNVEVGLACAGTGHPVQGMGGHNGIFVPGRHEWRFGALAYGKASV